MTIALLLLNVVLSTIVLVAVVGGLARSIQPRHLARNRRRAGAARAPRAATAAGSALPSQA